jgi:hypothetical protein
MGRIRWRGEEMKMRKKEFKGRKREMGEDGGEATTTLKRAASGTQDKTTHDEPGSKYGRN